MQVHIFRSTGRIFGVTANAEGANLPSRFSPWAPFKTVELNRNVPTPGLNAAECLDDIEKYGFHVTDAHVRITESVVNEQ
jgi:hypothetical protein